MSDVPAPAVEVLGVTKSFDGGLIKALDGVSFTVSQGEFVAITGPSGCGKSTLLHLIAALDEPTSGRIAVHGRDLREVDTDSYRRMEVGLVFQLHNLLPNLTALANVEVAMFSNGMTHSEQQARARELLAAVGLADKEAVTPPRLAGGERQRVAIARALANNPKLLLADEPTGNLDSASAARILALFNHIRDERGISVLLVTHDPAVAAASGRVIHMQDGRTVAETAAT